MATNLQRAVESVSHHYSLDCQDGILSGEVMFNHELDKDMIFYARFNKDVPKRWKDNNFIMELNPSKIQYSVIEKATKDTTIRLETYIENVDGKAKFSNHYKDATSEVSRNSVVISTDKDPFAGMIQFSVGPDDERDLRIEVDLIYVKPEFRHTSAWLDLTTVAADLIKDMAIEYCKRRKNVENMSVYYTAQAYSNGGQVVAEIIGSEVFVELDDHYAGKNGPEFIRDIEPFFKFERTPWKRSDMPTTERMQTPPGPAF